jgi:hypothetical protein
MRIQDGFEGLREGDRLEWNFHLAPGVKAACLDGGVRLEAGGKTLVMRPAPGMETGIDEVDHSPAYGVFERALNVRVWREIRGTAGEDFLMLFEWACGNA